MDDLRGAKLLVIGVAKSGLACARAAARAGAEVVLIDKGNPAIDTGAAAALDELGVQVHLGSENVSFLEGAEMVLPSPGVSVHSPLIRAALERGLPCYSEIEFAVRLYPHDRLIAITGTNGKTTVTTLVARMLESSGISCAVGGNIGTPLIEVLEEASDEQWVVAEVSSFQLELAPTFNPAIAAFLNFEEDHLDWHANLEEYFEAKAGLIRRLTPESSATLQWSDPGIRGLASQTRAQSAFFASSEVGTQLELQGTQMTFDGWTLRGRIDGSQVEIDTPGVYLRGRHNYENCAASALIALRAGATRDGLTAALTGFKGLPHRIEFVGEVAGVSYYDDSKATNPHAASAAVESFAGDPLIIMLGGRNKGSDLEQLAQIVAARAKKVICFGESGPDFKALLPADSAIITSTLEEGVAAAASAASPGDIVLLAPACASFDAFTGYAQRGKAFATAVKALSNGRGESAGDS